MRKTLGVWRTVVGAYLQVEKELAAVDVVEHKVQLAGGLEREVQAHEERVVDVAQQHVALRHDVLDLVLSSTKEEEEEQEEEE